MAIELPKNRLGVRETKTTKRNIPIEQIIAVEGQSPVASGIEVAGNAVGQALAKRAELQRQGQLLAQGKQDDLEKFNREADLKRELLGLKNPSSGSNVSSPGGYFIPRGTGVESGRPVYSNSKRPGLFYDDMTPATEQIGKLNLQTLPSDQIEQETKMDTLGLALQKVKDSYSDELVGPVASRVGKAKQYAEPLANENAANFYSNLADMRNQIVYLRSGKQINEEEYKRLLNAIPNENTSPTDFKVRLSNFEQLKNTMLSSRQKNLSGTGYRTSEGLKPLTLPKPKSINNDPLGLR